MKKSTNLKRTLIGAIKRAITLAFILFCGISCFAGCSLETLHDSLYGTETGLYDSLGRERLAPVQVHLNETEYIQTADTEDDNLVGTTNSNTGSLYWKDSPYAHAKDNNTEAVLEYRFTNYKIVQDGSDLYFTVV